MAIGCERILFECDFDNSDDTEACYGKFDNRAKGQNVGVFKNLTVSKLSYVITDVTSISMIIFENY